MLKARSFLEPTDIPVEISQPMVNMRIACPDHSPVGFEKRYISDIKANNRGTQTDVSLGQNISKVVWPLRL